MERRMVIGGDVFPQQTEVNLFEEGRIEQLFSQEVLELFQNSDFSICNLEGVLTNCDVKRPKCGPSIKASPNAVRAIKRLGIDCVLLANNHVTDYGLSGFRDTISCLKENGIDCFGAGENTRSIIPYYQKDLWGKRFIFYAVAETVFNLPSNDDAGANLYDEYRVCNELKTLKGQCDYLIVLYHGGAEYFQYPTPWIRTRFHRMADSGADCVIAQHTHCIGAEEYYNGAYLLFGQGNFYLRQSNYPSMTRYGLLLELSVLDGSLQVKRHLVHLDGKMVAYQTPQDLTGFLERSRRLAEGDSFEKEFSEYSLGWFVKWLLEFRGLCFKDRLLRKLMSADKFYHYLRTNYSDHTVLRMLEHVRGEEDVEVMQRGLEDFFRARK